MAVSLEPIRTPVQACMSSGVTLASASLSLPPPLGGSAATPVFQAEPERLQRIVGRRPLDAARRQRSGRLCSEAPEAFSVPFSFPSRLRLRLELPSPGSRGPEVPPVKPLRDNEPLRCFTLVVFSPFLPPFPPPSPAIRRVPPPAFNGLLCAGPGASEPRGDNNVPPVPLEHGCGGGAFH